MEINLALVIGFAFIGLIILVIAVGVWCFSSGQDIDGYDSTCDAQDFHFYD